MAFSFLLVMWTDLVGKFSS